VMKRNFGENAKIQEFIFPHWYCKGFWKYRDDPTKQPFDQHLLLACVAPRALLIESFLADWFDPEGEFVAVKAASPVWRFLTGRGLECDTLAERPAPFEDAFVTAPFGYVVRSESHGLSGHDWMWALDFADQSLGKK